MLTDDHREEISSDQLVRSVPSEVYPYAAGVTGGVLAGAAMAAIMALWGVASGHSIWYPVNLIAATLLPELQAADPATLAQFSLAGVIIGTAIHFGLSALLGLLYVMFLPTLPGPPLLWSMIVGPILWLISEYLILPIINPAMRALVDVNSFFVCHVVYSLVLGWFVARAQKVPAG